MESGLPPMPRPQTLAENHAAGLLPPEGRLYYVGSEPNAFDYEKALPIVCGSFIGVGELSVAPKMSALARHVLDSATLLNPSESEMDTVLWDTVPSSGDHIRLMTNDQRVKLAADNLAALGEDNFEWGQSGLMKQLVELMPFLPDLEEKIIDLLNRYIGDRSADQDFGRLSDQVSVISSLSVDLLKSYPSILDASTTVVDALLKNGSIYMRIFALPPAKKLAEAQPGDYNNKLAEVLRSLISTSSDDYYQAEGFYDLMLNRHGIAYDAASCIEALDPHQAQSLRDELCRSLEKAIDKWPFHEISARAASMIPFLKKSDRTKIIRNILSSDGSHDVARTIAVIHIELVDEGDMSELIELAGMGDEGWAESVLDRKASEDEVLALNKSGSDTYIFPKQHKASMRVISANSAISWFEAFHNWDEWYRAGFNYVPVEPIQDMDFYHQRYSRGCVEEVAAVVTTNLPGRSLADWEKYRTEFIDELNFFRRSIVRTLKKMKVDHGHLHNGNFVVVPYKTPEDKVDYTRCPRLYVIDFDRAKFSIRDVGSELSE